MTNIVSAHWRTLKKMVEDAGGVWTDKEAAVKFLLGSADKASPTEKPGLDKSRPYAEVFGTVEGADGARYMQDGVYYNLSGQKVG